MTDRVWLTLSIGALVSGLALIWSAEPPRPRRSRTAAQRAGRTAQPGAAALPAWFGQPEVPDRRLAGRVQAPGARPAGARVLLASLLTESGLRPEEQVAPDQGGAFDFGLRPAAVYTVTALVPGRTPAIAVVDLRDPRPAVPAAALRLRSAPCDARLRGSIRDPFSGAGIARARLQLQPPEAPAALLGESDAQGAYDLCLPPITTSLRVQARGYGLLDVPVVPAGTVRRDLALLREATILGQVVQAEDGKPVAAALVRLLRQVADRPPAPVLSTVTDGSGRFRLQGLSPGRFLVTAATDILVTDEGVDVTVEDGQGTPDVTCRVGPAPSLRGVIRSAGAPLAGARLRLGRRGLDWHTDAVSQEDGSFLLEPAPAGRVLLRVRSFARVEPGLIDIDPGEAAEVTVQVAAGGSLAGRVLYKGEPVEGAAVTGVGSPGLTVQSGPGGEFKLLGLPQAGHLIARMPGRRGRLSDLPFGHGEHRGGLTVELLDEAAISGTIVDQRGAPVAEALVLLTRDGGWRTTGTTSRDGAFAIRPLRGAGVYRAQVSWRAGDPVRVPLPPATPFPVIELPDDHAQREGVRLAVQLEYATVSGRILDGSGGGVRHALLLAAPMGPDMTPRLSDLGEAGAGPLSTSSGEGGAFALSLPAIGRYALRALDQGGAEALAVGIAPGQRDLLLRIVPRGTIEGTLAGFADSPQVTAAYGPDVQQSVTAPSAASRFTLRGLVAGRYLLTAGPASGQPVPVEVQPGAVTRAALQARVTAHLAGRVHGEPTGGRPSRHQCQAFFPLPDGQRLPVTTRPPVIWTDTDGRFAFGDLPAGRLSIRCRGQWQEVTLTEGQEPWLDVLPRGDR